MKITLTPCYDEYRVFRCSDCDPDFMEDDDEGERYESPYEVILPVDGRLVTGSVDEAGPLDSCPRCGSRLSLCCDSIVTVERKRG